MGDHGPSIKAPRVYEALRRKGYSKQKAARISNAHANGTLDRRRAGKGGALRSGKRGTSRRGGARGNASKALGRATRGKGRGRR